MHSAVPVERLVNLLNPAGNLIFNMSVDQAAERVGSGDPQQVRAIDGHFALIHKQGQQIRMARSLGRPMRYFLAKRTEGPCLIVAERIDEIYNFLCNEGLAGQFHPSYTRMVPAHHIVELALVGCPDPNPEAIRYFTPQRNRWSTDLDEISRKYMGKLAGEIDHWLNTISKEEPLGVLFSGGIDSGAVLLVLYHVLLKRGESPARLKAFTLTVDEGGSDTAQAEQFLSELDLTLFWEQIPVHRDDLDYREAVKIIEDYKPLDVQAATMTLALCRGIRNRYPDWKYLIDGDGGDENLKDYPIEENSELTIRSVLNNPLLYQEGWGVQAVKHSLVYSGGQSRGHVRTHAPARHFGFHGFSPYALPNVIEVAEGIPFVELTDWQQDRLYELKGEIIRRGVKAITGLTMPIFEKRRFQQGAMEDQLFKELFPAEETTYRQAFAGQYE
ncbi:asparagine synthase-related protein [Rubinisphaera italica]|uniref:Asparagine synthase n=1 Tax=Rubinisphaera italica TaxID=2527969 RepID=A0A5C5XBJ0_9PLAN|nr:asparagine synthase-related protein [Rubinisphaera italica]TWT60537.1 Asparagine synthase [Rubinisphaera italica]